MSENSDTDTPQGDLDPGLLAAHKAYEDAINSNDTDTVMAIYDRDAAIWQPDGEVVTGTENIREWVAGYFGAFKTHWKKVPLRNFVMGEYGFDEGIDTAVDVAREANDDGDIVTKKWNCKGILVYKRQEDGSWKIFRDIWNNTTPPVITKEPASESSSD